MHILLSSKNFYQQKALYIRMESRIERGAEGCKWDLRERISHDTWLLLYHCICYHKKYITNFYVDVGRLSNYLKYCLTASIYFARFLLYFIHPNSFQWTEIQHAKVFDAVPLLFEIPSLLNHDHINVNLLRNQDLRCLKGDLGMEDHNTLLSEFIHNLTSIPLVSITSTIYLNLVC